jgi:hypothetical protein
MRSAFTFRGTAPRLLGLSEEEIFASITRIWNIGLLSIGHSLLRPFAVGRLSINSRRGLHARSILRGNGGLVLTHSRIDIGGIHTHLTCKNCVRGNTGKLRFTGVVPDWLHRVCELQRALRATREWWWWRRIPGG